MTMNMATHVARLAMIKTNRRISRCNVVIDDNAVEESFAIRPLRMSTIQLETFNIDRGGKYKQDGIIADLKD
jgi:hypothetical protein